MLVDTEGSVGPPIPSPILRLAGAAKDYAWGSPDRIPALMGVPATGEPVAEVWFGAHPAGPTEVDPGGKTLAQLIAADPQGMLGDDVRQRFGDRLPYLVKFLAAASPLSIQVHPSMAQAKAGFAADEAAGLDRAAPDRSYRDANHKPEVVVALTNFEALVGFRDAGQSVDFLTSVNVDGLAQIVDAVGADAGDALRLILETDAGAISELVMSVARSCAEAQPGDPWKAEKDLIVRLAASYPGDPGVLTAALLNRIELKPGQAVFLEAGTLHAYVEGLALEVMASSDNVLRAGLTPKFVNIPELLEVVRPVALEPKILEAKGPETHLGFPVPEFRMSRFELRNGDVRVETDASPGIILCVDGEVGLTPSHERPAAVDPVYLKAGQAAWSPAEVGELVLNGTGVAWVVTAGSPTS